MSNLSFVTNQDLPIHKYLGFRFRFMVRVRVVAYIEILQHVNIHWPILTQIYAYKYIRTSTNIHVFNPHIRTIILAFTQAHTHIHSIMHMHKNIRYQYSHSCTHTYLIIEIHSYNHSFIHLRTYINTYLYIFYINKELSF